MGGLFSHESKKGGGSHAFAPPASSTGASNTAAVGASVTSKDRAVLELKVARDKLKKYQKKLEKESVKLTEQAKALIRQDKKVSRVDIYVIQYLSTKIYNMLCQTGSGSVSYKTQEAQGKRVFKCGRTASKCDANGKLSIIFLLTPNLFFVHC